MSKRKRILFPKHLKTLVSFWIVCRHFLGELQETAKNFEDDNNSEEVKKGWPF